MKHVAHVEMLGQAIAPQLGKIGERIDTLHVGDFRFSRSLRLCTKSGMKQFVENLLKPRNELILPPPL
jgi:hypothetical protein